MNYVSGFMHIYLGLITSAHLAVASYKLAIYQGSRVSHIFHICSELDVRSLPASLLCVGTIYI